MCGGSESGQREKELFTHRAPVTAPHCSAIFWLGIRSRSQTQPPAPARVAIPLPVSLSLLAPVAAHRLFLAWDPPAYFFLLFFFSFSSSSSSFPSRLLPFAFCSGPHRSTSMMFIKSLTVMNSGRVFLALLPAKREREREREKRKKTQRFL